MEETRALPDRTRRNRDHPARPPSSSQQAQRTRSTPHTTLARGGIGSQNRRGRGRGGNRGRPAPILPVTRNQLRLDREANPPLPAEVEQHVENMKKIDRLEDPPNESDFDEDGFATFYTDPAFDPPEVVKAMNLKEWYNPEKKRQEGRIFYLIDGTWMRYGKSEAYQETYDPVTQMYTRTPLAKSFGEWYAARARARAGNALSLSRRRRRMYGFEDGEEAGEQRFC